jgi:Flp pilus assembly protein TadD
VLVRKGRLEEAMVEFRKAAELDPTYQKAAQNIADTEELIQRKAKKRTKKR